MELTDLTMLELAAKLAAGEVSSVEATRACLARIDQVDAKLKRLPHGGRATGALAAGARRATRGARRARRRGPAGRRAGRAQGHLLTEGLETTAGSRILEGFVPPTTPPWSRGCARRAR